MSPRAQLTRRFVAVAAGLVLTSAGVTVAHHSASAAVPGTTHKKPASHPVGPILLIGDSVSASIESLLPALLRADGYSLVMDAQNGRCVMRSPNRCHKGDAWDALTKLAPDFHPTLALIELGYNDSTRSFPPGVNGLMRALTQKGIKRVLWINMSERRPAANGAGSFYGPLNAHLRRAAKHWHQLMILDWNAASTEPADTNWFIPLSSKGKADLIHLTGQGQRQFAKWIRSELDLLRAAGALPDPTGAFVPVTTTTTAASRPTVRPALKVGDQGTMVLELQKALTARGFKTLTDGTFGPGTARVVAAFQRAAGLPADGTVGVRTWKALGP